MKKVKGKRQKREQKENEKVKETGNGHVTFPIWQISIYLMVFEM